MSAPNSSATTTSASSLSLSSPPDRIRLVTIVAHVDHGKTTLADHLISYATQLLSDRLAGKIRYLDYDPEEQRRGITIRTSGIVLTHHVPPALMLLHDQLRNNNNAKHQLSKQQKKKEDASVPPPPPHNAPTSLTVHLHDSPGHSDFMWEVSTSLLATDAALVVIDVVEGMGARTHQVLRETMARRLVPVLVLNKLDRLCVELHLSPMEAHARLRELLELVNATAAAMVVATEQSEEEDDEQEELEKKGGKIYATPNRSQRSEQNDDDDAPTALEELWVFDPARGNVIFASALHGMGFTVLAVCQALFQSKSVTVKPRLLAPFLFGDYKIVTDEKGQDKVFKWKASTDDHNVPLFVQFALEPLWKIWGGLSNNSGGATPDPTWLQAIVDAMQVGATGSNAKRSASGTPNSTIPSTAAELSKLLQQHGAKSIDSITRTVLKRYRPLAHAVLDAVAVHGPSPTEAASSDELQRRRLFRLADPSLESNATPERCDFHVQQQLAVYECDPQSPVVVAQVCKFVVTQYAHLQDMDLLRNTPQVSSSHEPVLLGLTRVLSGTLESDATYFAIGSTDDDCARDRKPWKIRLYLLLGSSYVFVPRVPAGHICAVLGLEGAVASAPATICSSALGSAVETPESFRRKPQPLLKVHIEPALTKHEARLKRGLRLLQLSDAGIQVSETSRGETVLSCCGEMHLEQSLVDLKTKLLLGEESIELRVSDPIVDFGESTDWMEREADHFGAYLDAIYEAPHDATDHSVPQPTQRRVAPAARQSSIPPYNEEEGLNGAGYGRARSLLAGRSAAIRVRVVPAAPIVYRAVATGKVVDEECESELLVLARALKFPKSSTAQDVLDSLVRQCVYTSDSNESLMVENPALSSGLCVVGVLPPTGTDYTVSADSSHGFEVLASPSMLSEEGNSPHAVAAYMRLTERIRTCGFASTEQGAVADTTKTVQIADRAALEVWRQSMKGSLVAGFQLALKSGSICEEPVRNVLVILEGVEVAVRPADRADTEGGGDDVTSEAPASDANEYSSGLVSARPLSSGMVVSSLRTGIRCALLTRPARLVEGMFKLTLHSSLSGLGSLYAVLSKRRGRVIEDSVVDGTDLLLIEAMLPAAEAFGLAPELFGKTSGEVTAPEMVFSHWELLRVDPFWIPTSVEEREDFGEVQTAGDASTGVDNPAIFYIRKIRSRKGLPVDSSRTVVAAEKQRTMKR